MVADTKMEREIKLDLLNQRNYDEFLALLPAPVQILRQDNLYVDDERGTLRRERVMLRVRVSQLSSVITVKRRLSVTHGYFSAEEEEADLPHPWSGDLSTLAAHPSVLRLQTELGMGPPRITGAIRNIRRCIAYQGLSLELDHSRFPGQTERWELEVETETPEQALALLMPLFAAANVPFVPQTETKYARFLRALGEDDAH